VAHLRFHQERGARGGSVSRRGREDVPALKKETEPKEDGRYIIFYTFEDEEEGED
jgi:hypothetical protein